ncbi:DUF2851 family protein [Nostoc ellipsosporum NOK]|nr:DUF2851 family protein [Nostoc ellipsosporum NOK]
MDERLLQFIWQQQYFNNIGLSTTDGEWLTILSPGRLNRDQGPDFLDSRIRVDGLEWRGTIELHIRTSDWQRHRHEKDPHYGNVILHVVWDHDHAPEQRMIPVLELNGRVPHLLLERYRSMMWQPAQIPCEGQLTRVPSIHWHAWKERLLMERLTDKSEHILEWLQQTGGHWEEVCWWLIARNFGVRLNSDAFEQIARSIPLRIVARHKQQLNQVEALLFGQAGLLHSRFREEYPRMLFREYRYLQHKWALKPVLQPLSFLRMRPVHFPTVRLAQLSVLLHQSNGLFARLLETRELKEVRHWFDVTANDYWHYHFRLDEPAAYQVKHLGAMMQDNLVINTLAPLLFAYGEYHGQPVFRERALMWLEGVSPENNRYSKLFARLGRKPLHGADSQAMVQLKEQYCDERRCLDCVAGNYLLRNPIDADSKP